MAAPVWEQEPSAEARAEAPAPSATEASGVPEHAELEDFSGEALEERLQSTHLARRCSAYEELQAAMATDANACEVMGRAAATAFAEALPKGQDAALNALACYLRHCPGIEQRGHDLLPWVRKLAEHKCIDKPKMQQLAPLVVLLIAEITECPAVLQELINSLQELDESKKKNAGFVKKQVAFIIKLMGQLLGDFGVKKMPPKLGYVSIVLKYISDSDRGIREACYGLLLELSACLGDISSLIVSMDEPQKKEVAKRLEGVEVRSAAKAPRRCYRGESEEAPAAASDDLFEKVDPNRKLPRGWCISAVYSMEKWKEKLAHLQALSSILEAPAEKHLLQPSDFYASLVPTMQRMLKSESNIPVLTEMAKCMGLLSRGLKRHFERSARQLLPVVLGRINDKSVWKPHCLIERVEQLLWALPLEVLFEELQPHIGSKSLFVKKEALSLLVRSLELPQVLQSYPDAVQRFFLPIATMAMPLLDDADNTMRQEAVKALVKLVAQNRESADAVLERLPPHRRAAFEEELRKVQEPQSPEKVPRPLSPGPLRTSPLKQRLNTVPVSSPRPNVPQEEKQEMKPAKQVAQGKENQEIKVETPKAVETPRAVETPLIRQMAEEIRNLRSKVKQLEMDKERHEKEAKVDTPSPGPASTRLRAPRVASAEPRDASCPQPRPPSPLRLREAPASPLRREATPSRTRRPTPPRRDATPSQREPTPLRRDATPTRREATPLRRDATPTRREMPRRDISIRREPSRRELSREATPRATTPRYHKAPTSWTPGAGPAAGQDELGESVVPFQIALPRLTKQARQLKEKSQYWGPEAIPSDHLSALREQWRNCVEDWLWRQMFSDRLEEQLAGLSHWQKQAEDYTQSILDSEVLDMLLKWLTWMLWHTNTKVWRAMLEVLLSLLRNLDRLEVGLTDREAQILVPNVVERSGHNILAIREMMQEALRLCSILAPRSRMLPMLLNGLTSKSKRSAACSMKAIGDALDRHTALSLLRSQKDLNLVMKLTVDKDPEVRRCSVQTCALLSLHLDDDVFTKVCRGLPPLAKQPVQHAALLLQEDSDCRL